MQGMFLVRVLKKKFDMKIYAEFDFSSFVVEVEVITPPPPLQQPTTLIFNFYSIQFSLFTK